MTEEKKKKAKKVKAVEVVEAKPAPKVEQKRIKNLLPNTFMIGGALKIIGYGDALLSDEIKNDERAMKRINRGIETGVLAWL